MKKSLFCTALILGVGTAFLLPAFCGFATEATSTSSVTGSSAVAPHKLPYGVEDVLKLSRAGIGEEIILNYVQNSGTIYNLSPTDIVYLRDEGVSDRVINAMLDQRSKVSEEAAATAPQPAAAQTAAVNEANVAPAPAQTQPAPVYVQPPAPDPAPSTVYIIPYPAASAAYYGYYRPSYGYYGYPGYCAPYYYPDYYCRPGISFGFSFGGGHFGGGHYARFGHRR